MRIYFNVMLAVELKEGGRLSWDVGVRTVHNEQMGCVQSATNADIIEHVKDVLVDVTKHNDTIMWRVVNVMEGSSVELDSESTTIITEPL